MNQRWRRSSEQPRRGHRAAAHGVGPKGVDPIAKLTGPPDSHRDLAAGDQRLQHGAARVGPRLGERQRGRQQAGGR
jgi:hypothetical protein